VLVERWYDGRWTIDPVPDSAALTAVSCTSPTTCIATGKRAARWDGHTWTIDTVPFPRASLGADFIGLNRVSCTSATQCVSVGSRQINCDECTPETFADRWDGHRWSLLHTPTAISTASRADRQRPARLLGDGPSISAPACSSIGRSRCAGPGPGGRSSVYPTQHERSRASSPAALNAPLSTTCRVRRLTPAWRSGITQVPRSSRRARDRADADPLAASSRRCGARILPPWCYDVDAAGSTISIWRGCFFPCGPAERPAYRRRSGGRDSENSWTSGYRSSFRITAT
jgi:hypothetical protein